MKTEYRIQFEGRLLEDGVFWHVVRWFLLVVVTGGVALVFYPFYFVRFIADRITVIQVTEEKKAADLQVRAQKMALEESVRDQGTETTENSDTAA